MSLFVAATLPFGDLFVRRTMILNLLAGSSMKRG
jgi:hypothetical protein